MGPSPNGDTRHNRPGGPPASSLRRCRCGASSIGAVRRPQRAEKGVKGWGRWSKRKCRGFVHCWLARLTFQTRLGRCPDQMKRTASASDDVGEPVDTAVEGADPDQATQRWIPVERLAQVGITLREKSRNIRKNKHHRPGAWPTGETAATHLHQPGRGAGRRSNRGFNHWIDDKRIPPYDRQPGQIVPRPPLQAQRNSKRKAITSKP